MELPEPQSRQFTGLIAEIEKGEIKIPQFQREFVWTMQKSAGLIDSIIKGYPIGTFIFWRTKERLRSIRDLGGQKLPEPQTGELVNFVLDGQQRLTSLYACLKGIKLKRVDSKDNDDFSEIYIHLQAEEHEQIVVTEKVDTAEGNYISVLDLLTGDFDILGGYPKEYHDKLKLYKYRIESYQYSIIQIKDAPIDIATEIFTRINIGGKPLTLFEIMVAKTFDYEKGFDLSEKYKQLIDDKLDAIGYETISSATVLQIVSVIIASECKRETILKLDKEQFIATWDSAIDAIERTVDYLRDSYRIPVSQLLPYNALIVPFAYFFSKHHDKPTGDTQRFLQDFFWRCSLSARYTSSHETKLAQDIKRIDKILNGELPTYDWPISTSSDFISKNGWFNAGRSYIKAVLCIYAYFQPKSFNDNAIVKISNDWLKRANSKNYHHFFPRAYLTKQGIENSRINHILNITIIPDTMKTHLIDIDSFGIWEDDYDAFRNGRAKLLSQEMEKRVIKQEIDKIEQPALKDDYEEEGTVVE